MFDNIGDALYNSNRFMLLVGAKRFIITVAAFQYTVFLFRYFILFLFFFDDSNSINDNGGIVPYLYGLCIPS